MTDSSLPSSPKLPHNGPGLSTPLMRGSLSGSLISDCAENEAESVLQLRNELRDKEMKLTDIRLEALSSAHQLDQLREAMNRMQSEIEKLKAENDRLKAENSGKSQSQISISSSPRQSVVQPQHSVSLTESSSLDMLLEDASDGTLRKESRHVKIVVSFLEEMKWREMSDCRQRMFLIGCIGVGGKTKWDVLDGVVRRLFKVNNMSHMVGTSPGVEIWGNVNVLRYVFHICKLKAVNQNNIQRGKEIICWIEMIDPKSAHFHNTWTQACFPGFKVINM
ncbi:Hypothetical predicted protein [Pelobates cultripes]|nr:Hypothetical predicted protein [Pelobates cultripes]